MKPLLRRAWEALFPIPRVSQLEAFLTRAFLGAVLHRFLFRSAMEEIAQPVPVGLAHLFHLTWLSDPHAYAMFHFAFMAAAFLYASGLMLAVVLPVVTALHLLPYTLLNSQGHPHHGYQIISLTLLGMSVVTVAQAFRGQAQRLPGLWRTLMLLLLVPLAVMAFDRFMSRHGIAEGMAAWSGSPFGAQGPDYAFSLVRVVAFTLLAAPLAWLAAGGADRARPSPLLNASLLMTGQFMIAAAYLVSVCSKMKLSNGKWLFHSQYVALDFVKTMRQSYYSALDPKFAHDPDGVVFLMSHENLARLFFGGGVFLEAALILAVGTRWLALAFGVMLLIMHSTIEELMTLTFPTNEYMDALFYVNVPFLIALAISRRDPSRALPSRTSSS